MFQELVPESSQIRHILRKPVRFWKQQRS